MSWSKEVFARNLRYYMESRGKTQKELAAIVGVSAPTMNDWLKAKKYPRIDKIEILANYFGILKSDLIEEKTAIPGDDLFSPLPRTKKWRVLGGAACGDPLHMELEGETITAPADIDADYVFRCVGDSMIGARILDGDIVFVKSGEVENGQIGVVRVEDSYSLKRIYHGEDYLELRSENPMHPPIILRGEQINAEIIGRAVCFQSRVI